MDHLDSADFDKADFDIECGTCVASGTTACADCVVTHLLANDDGPIDFVTVPVAAPTTPEQRAIELFERAGLLDDPVQLVDPADFAAGVVAGTVAVP
jgi:hypothetical protein